MDWKQEIQAGSLAEALAPHIKAGDDDAVKELLNAKTIDAVGSVNRVPFIKWAASNGMRAVIHDVSVDIASPLRSSALALLDIIQGGGDMDSIDFSDTNNIDMLDAWVSLGKLTELQRDQLLALATVKISRAELVMGREATVFDVASALRNDDGSMK